MQCPKCKGTYLQVHGSFAGWQKIEFKPESDLDGDLEVIDSEPTDFEWTDNDLVECLECWHQGTVSEFTPAEDSQSDLIFHEATKDEAGVTCDECGEPIHGGERIVEDPDKQKYYHEDCTQ